MTTSKKSFLIFLTLSMFFLVNYQLVNAIAFTSELKEKIKDSIVLHIGSADSVVYGVKKQINKSTPEIQPLLINGTTLLPLRFIAESIGAEVLWDEDTKGIIIEKDSKTINFKIGSNKILVNGVQSTLDVIIDTYKDETFVPLRVIAETLDQHVIYQDEVIFITPHQKNDIDSKLIEEVKLLLPKEIRVVKVDETTYAGLSNKEQIIKASEIGDYDKVKSLLKAGVSPNTRNKWNISILYISSQEGHENIVKLLIDYGVNVNANNGGTSALHSAKTSGITKLLINAGAKVNMQNNYGDTPLIRQLWNTESIKVLLNAGANPNIRGYLRVTPILYAASQGETEAIKLLVAAKGDLFATDIGVEKQYKYTKYIETLFTSYRGFGSLGEYINFGDGNNALMYATLNNNVETMKYLVNAGLNPNHQNNNSYTPLMIAVFEDNIDALNYLIKISDVNLKNKDGRNALSLAAEYSYKIDILKILLNYNIDPNTKDNNGKTPLMYTHTAEQAEVLINAGADPHIKDNEGENALDYALIKNERTNAQDLVDYLKEVTLPPVVVIYNGEKLNLSISPVSYDDLVYIPIEELFTKLGAAVNWDESSRTIKASFQGKTYERTYDSDTVIINGEEYIDGFKPLNIKNTMMIDYWDLYHLFKVELDWDDEGRILTITDK